MADSQPTPAFRFMDLPLEVRHTIFEVTAARDVKPKNLLRLWFEKEDVKTLVAQAIAANPTGPAPQVVRHNEYEEDSDVPEPEEEAEEQDSDDEDGEAEDGEGEDEDDNEDGDEDNEDEDGEDAEGEGEVDIEEPEDEDEDAMDEGDVAHAQDAAEPATADEAQLTSALTQAAATAQPQHDSLPQPADDSAMEADKTAAGGSADTDTAEIQSGEAAALGPQDEVDEDGDSNMAGEEEEADAAEEGEDAQDGEQDEDEGGDGQDEGEDDEDGQATAQASNTPPAAPVVEAARKWRHIPNFMRISHCPPPVELLLTSKQLNDEAKDWFYDVAILRISATNSFAHTSFFEEAFSQITDAAFSPMENIRKVDVMFVWDTTWLRADDTGFAQAIFPALLRQRSDFVHKILSQAPDLREVTIHWHDSAHDDESMMFMLDILAPFHDLSATVKVEEHYIAADAKPLKRSIAGKQRLQYQHIVDAGLDRLF